MMGAVGIAAQASAAQADAALRSAATKEQPAVINTLRELVTTESGSTDHEGVATLMTYLDKRLRALDAKVDRVASATGGPDLVRGVFTGNGALKVMLIAHADTVYDRGTLAKEPYHQTGNLLYGPGIADDKGGIAVILHAMALLKARGWNDYATVTVLFNPDEEIGSPGSGEAIATLAAEHDVVLSFEPSPAKAVIEHEGVLLSAAGTSQVRMTVEGLSAHAGAAPEQGRNALVELSHQILQMTDLSDPVSGTKMNWTLASAGTARNVIPAAAQATADVRVIRVADYDTMERRVRERAKTQRIPDAKVEIVFERTRPPMEASERSRRVAERARRIYSELGGVLRVEEQPTGGGTDAAFAALQTKAPVLEGFGLRGFGAHSNDAEYIEISSIEPRLYLAARLIMDALVQSSF
jgi:glutamate carboxypeptidase